MFRLFARLVAAACLSPLAAAPALAQQGLSLHDAQRFALARSQQLTAQDAAAASVREMGMAAGQLPDPVLKFGVDNLPITGPDRFSLTQDFMTQRRIGVMQEITRADKRRLKVERVERDAQRIQAERELAAAVIRRDTALAWIEGYYAQATAELLRRQAEETRLQIQGAEIAYRAGRGSQADIFAARGALASLQDRVRQAERTAGSARLMLTRWVGAATGAQPLAGRAEWDQGAPPEWTLDHLRGHPQLATLAAEIEAADTEVRQAQANTRADWTVEASFIQRGPAYSNMISLGVTIPLQIDRPQRQDREVAAKLAALAAARARLDEALRVHEAEVLVARNDWNANKERMARLQAELLPAARQRTEAALTVFRTGKGDLASVLLARRDEVDAQVQILALETETARLWAQLAYLGTSSGDSNTNKERQ